MIQALTNAQIFDGDSILENHVVLIEGGKVISVTLENQAPANAEVIDLGGQLLAPGYIDIQINGGGGILFNDDPTVEALKTLSDSHRKFGTTSMLPTLISDDFAVMLKAAEAIKGARAQQMPGIIGIHFEGPYLNVARKGVHDPNKIRPFEDAAIDLYTNPDLGVVIATLAPEKAPPGLIKKLSQAGVRVCAGHTAGTYEHIQTALNDGLSGFTHLFNAMTPMESRAPGVVGAALEDQGTWCGIIADGHHVHPATLKVAIAAKQTGKMVLISDAMPTVGVEDAADKSFTIRGETITAKDGLCATASGTLAGSDLDMASAVRNTVSLLGLPVEEALRMAALYPAAFLGLDKHLGRIAPGYQADFVLLDEGLNVQNTWINGINGVNGIAGESYD